MEQALKSISARKILPQWRQAIAGSCNEQHGVGLLGTAVVFDGLTTYFVALCNVTEGWYFFLVGKGQSGVDFSEY